MKIHSSGVFRGEAKGVISPPEALRGVGVISPLEALRGGGVIRPPRDLKV